MRQKWIFLRTGLTAVACLLLAYCAKEKTVVREKPVRMKAVLDIVLVPQNGQREWCEELSKLTGVEWFIVQPLHDQYSKKLRFIFLSGDLPDICEIQTGDYIVLAASGKLLALNDYIRGSRYIKDIDERYYTAYRLRDGNIYGFPLNRGGGCVTYIRKDWLSNLGLEVPETWDEFYTVMKAFTENDPDGNGLADTIGYTTVVNNEFDYYNRMIMQGARFGFFKRGGEWVDGFTEPEMEDALERFRRCYEEGIIDHEIFTNTTTTVRTKLYESRVGIIEYWSGQWAVRLNESIRSTSCPESVLIAVPPVGDARYLERVAPCLAITKEAKDPEAAFRCFIDIMHDKGPGQMLFTYGVPDLHYKKTGGTYEMMRELQNPARTFNKAYVHPELTLNDWDLPIKPADDVIRSRSVHAMYCDQMLLPEGGEYYVQYADDIMVLKQNIAARIITGEYNIKEGIELYKGQSRSFHRDDILVELNR
ncbi:MAG: extracellular solute-binding protein [Spirochaetales bacterium]|nr:extracellular solute-binding protein [Spirochaetales bacterium]